MTWATTAAAITNLRSLIQDGPTDKLCSNKKLIGVQDGTNLLFKTFEFRRVTDFTVTNTFPFGVFKDGTALATSDFTSDDPATGSFKIVVGQVPTQRQTFTATYYYQWFLDADLALFLQEASQWLGLGSTYINVPLGLNPAALKYAAGCAYGYAAMKFMTRVAEVYKLEDAPAKEVTATVSAWRSLAKDFKSEAEKLRNDYYGRQGQGNAPLFGLSTGSVVDPQPRR